MMVWMRLAVACLAALMLLVMVRLFRGPTAADRVVALDAINTLVIASMILLSAIMGQTIFVDVAIVYALLSYVSTLYVAKFMGRGGDSHDR